MFSTALLPSLSTGGPARSYAGRRDVFPPISRRHTPGHRLLLSTAQVAGTARHREWSFGPGQDVKRPEGVARSRFGPATGVDKGVHVFYDLSRSTMLFMDRKVEAYRRFPFSAAPGHWKGLDDFMTAVVPRLRFDGRRFRCVRESPL